MRIAAQICAYGRVEEDQRTEKISPCSSHQEESTVEPMDDSSLSVDVDLPLIRIDLWSWNTVFVTVQSSCADSAEMLIIIGICFVKAKVAISYNLFSEHFLRWLLGKTKKTDLYDVYCAETEQRRSFAPKYLLTVEVQQHLHPLSATLKDLLRRRLHMVSGCATCGISSLKIENCLYPPPR